VIFVALAVVEAVPAGAGSSELRLTSVQTTFVTVDVKPDRSSAGDTEIATAIVYDGVSAAPIGRGELLCTVLNKPARSCTTTYALPQGRIVTAGVIDNLRRYEMAIVGGTGLYEQVRGFLSVSKTTLRPLRQLLSFHLLDVTAAAEVPPAALRPATTAPTAPEANPTRPGLSHGRGRKAGHEPAHGRGHHGY
jgi:hypothetical protein